MDGKHRSGTVDFVMTTKQAEPTYKLSPDLTGDAVPIEIETRNLNGVTVIRRDFYYLADFGTAPIEARHERATPISIGCSTLIVRSHFTLCSGLQIPVGMAIRAG